MFDLLLSLSRLLSSSWGKLEFEILQKGALRFAFWGLDFEKKLKIFITFFLEKFFQNGFFSLITNRLKRLKRRFISCNLFLSVVLREFCEF